MVSKPSEYFPPKVTAVLCSIVLSPLSPFFFSFSPFPLSFPAPHSLPLSLLPSFFLFYLYFKDIFAHWSEIIHLLPSSPRAQDWRLGLQR